MVCRKQSERPHGESSDDPTAPNAKMKICTQPAEATCILEESVPTHQKNMRGPTLCQALDFAEAIKCPDLFNSHYGSMRHVMLISTPQLKDMYSGRTRGVLSGTQLMREEAGLEPNPALLQRWAGLFSVQPFQELQVRFPAANPGWGCPTPPGEVSIYSGGEKPSPNVLKTEAPKPDQSSQRKH